MVQISLILASASPRRKEILTLAGFEFEIAAADVDETLPQSITPAQAVLTLSAKKARCVHALHPDKIILAADTLVAIGDKILGKPADTREAAEMLRLLSGRTHTVYTGVAICGADREKSFFEKTDVKFYKLSEDEISSYLLTGDSKDKAGSYGIQSCGCVLVESINGDYFNVMGLPIAKTARALQAFGITVSVRVNAESI